MKAPVLMECSKFHEEQDKLIILYSLPWDLSKYNGNPSLSFRDLLLFMVTELWHVPREMEHFREAPCNVGAGKKFAIFWQHQYLIPLLCT